MIEETPLVVKHLQFNLFLYRLFSDVGLDPLTAFLKVSLAPEKQISHALDLHVAGRLSQIVNDVRQLVLPLSLMLLALT